MFFRYEVPSQFKGLEQVWVSGVDGGWYGDPLPVGVDKIFLYPALEDISLDRYSKRVLSFAVAKMVWPVGGPKQAVPMPWRQPVLLPKPGPGQE